MGLSNVLLGTVLMVLPLTAAGLMATMIVLERPGRMPSLAAGEAGSPRPRRTGRCAQRREARRRRKA